MKQILSVCLFLLLALATNAQVKEVQFHFQDNLPNRTATTDDTIRLTFSYDNHTTDTRVIFNQNGNTWSETMYMFDNITFNDIAADTLDVDFSQGVIITWDGENVDIQNPYTDVTITHDGGSVAVNSTSTEADLTYQLRGTSSNGSITFTTAKKFILNLDNLQLTSPSCAAINILSDKRCLVYTTGSNTLSDGTASTDKGALQSKGKFEFRGNGVLNASGLAKHGIQSSGSTEIKSGNINILTAQKDGFNVDDFVMSGGTVNVNSLGDGIDGDKGYISISGGHITIDCASADVKGLGCDSTISVSGGNINITVSGNQSKGIKTKQSMTVTGGSITVNALGSVVLSEAGNGYEPSYCTGIKTAGNLTVSNGNVTILCPGTNAGGKAISSDSNIIVSGGLLDITATGACQKYTDSTGTFADYSSACLKANGDITVSGGTLNLTAGGRAITCDGNYLQQGGTIVATTSADGFTTIGTGTNCTDGFSAACLKADGNITFIQGSFHGTSTGLGGRGIVANGTMDFGASDADDDLLSVYVTTSGNPVNASSGSGGGPGGGGWPGGGSSADYWKGLPKGVKIDGNIHILSGHLMSYCAQPSGDPTGEAIESKSNILIDGGIVEANSYDDAINSGTGLTINNGKIWAYSRGNDAIDNNGTYTYINGGVVIALSDREMGIDASTDAGGHFLITGGTIISKGTMGPWDSPTSGSQQPYVNLGSNANINNGFYLKYGDDDIILFKAPTVSGSGFETGTKPPPGGGGSRGGGIVVSTPDLQRGTSYQLYTSITITGGSNWHGLFSGATCTPSGSSTNVTAQ